jgi:hypothetical protein
MNHLDEFRKFIELFEEHQSAKPMQDSSRLIDKLADYIVEGATWWANEKVTPVDGSNKARRIIKKTLTEFFNTYHCQFAKMNYFDVFDANKLVKYLTKTLGYNNSDHIKERIFSFMKFKKIGLKSI